MRQGLPVGGQAEGHQPAPSLRDFVLLHAARRDFLPLKQGVDKEGVKGRAEVIGAGEPGGVGTARCSASATCTSTITAAQICGSMFVVIQPPNAATPTTLRATAKRVRVALRLSR